MRRLLSQQNKKLGRIPSFSIPTTTCNKSMVKAQGCDKYCYARRLERLRPVMVAKYKWNFVQSKRATFVNDMCQELKYVGDVVRVHSSGDFYSQTYLNKWLTIARFNPHKTFFTYTKRIELDFSERPNNFKVILSDDKELFKNKVIIRLSKFPFHLYDGKARVKKKPKEEKGWIICPGFCEDCRVCWERKNPLITFKLK